MAIHSKLGASSAYRWMKCPGSVALSENLPNISSKYAEEGTIAHSLGELAIRDKMHPSNWLGQRLDKTVIGHDMVDAVTVYYDYVKNTVKKGDILHLEMPVSLDSLTPPVPMFGTSDCVIYKKKEHKLIVADYKHGAGVPVDVKDNPQLRYYALGALLELGNAHPVREIEIVIIQPRAPHEDGPIRSEVIEPHEILEFGANLIDAAITTTKPNAAIVPGDHCKFCRAAGICPSLRNQALQVAQMEFTDTPIDPATLPVQMVGDLLAKAELVEEWIKALRAHAFATLERGGTVPGWKLVARRGTRKWTDEENLVKKLEELGLKKDDIFESSLKSPAQIDKLLDKSGKEAIKAFCPSISSGVTLAPESDKRLAAASSAADDFTALP